ncbi:hypothetical protein ABSA28_00183 [Candidatus Hepatincolaceae symbiont of Richtersius coronifer]
MFSLPNKLEDIEPFQRAVRESLSELFPHNKYLFTVHQNTRNTHCHIAIKTKSDFDGKQLRIDKIQLFKIHNYIHDSCKKYEIDLSLAKQEIEIRKREKTLENFPDFFYKKLKNWKNMYENNVFPEIDWSEIVKANKFPELTNDDRNLSRLKALGLNEEKLNSFLHMDQENRDLALWTINKKSTLFDIEKPTQPFDILPNRYDQAPNWKNMYEKGSFPAISWEDMSENKAFCRNPRK